MTVKLDEILSLFHDDFVLPQIPQLYNFAVCRQPQPAQVGHRQIPLLWSALLCIIPKQNNSQSKMASLQPKNSGGPITKFWDAPETIATLEHVKGWLCKHAKKVSLDL